jgi:hypothetical protein
MKKKDVIVVWKYFFPSNSSSRLYETLVYNDGTTSCNCMGWTRRVASDGSRGCRHTIEVNPNARDKQPYGFHSQSLTHIPSGIEGQTELDIVRHTVDKDLPLLIHDITDKDARSCLEARLSGRKYA